MQEKIREGFNQEEEHHSLTLGYAVAQIREALAGAENSVDLALESQVVLL